MNHLKTILKSSALALVMGLAIAAPASADGGDRDGRGRDRGQDYGQHDNDGDGDASVTDDQAPFYGDGYSSSSDYDGPRYDRGDRRGGRDGDGRRDGRRGRGDHDGGGYHDGRGGDRYSDSWERGWRPWQGYFELSQHSVLTKHRLKRRLERQGFTHIRDLRPSRYGYGWRAFARDRYGETVVLRVDPYSGRVLGVRYA